MSTVRGEGQSREQLISIGAALSEEEDDAKLKERAIREWELTPAEAGELLEASAGLPNKYLMVSLKAVNKMLPFLEQGMRISDAKAAAGYLRPDQQAGADNPALSLPWDEKRKAPLTNNPVVQKALFEVRKLVNAIIKTYGKPDEIVIETAREMRGSIDSRNELTNLMRERERERERIADLLVKDHGIPKPSRDDILKYQLWLECNKKCPYTGQIISEGQLFRDGAVQIEHILPYSRSLDDSMMNKTLCFVKFNGKKGNRTPFEYFSSASDPGEQTRWEEIQIWAKNQKDIPWPKRRRFLQKEIDTDGCIARQLNDTRYINVLIRQYLLQLCPKDKRPAQYVRCSRGDLTAKLRRDWGLESVLDTEMKNREDHRHHAVDAVVVALTDSKRVHLLCNKDRARREAGMEIRQRDQTPEPWNGFRPQVKESVAKIIVSYKPTRKVSGPLHEEFFYGSTEKAGVMVRRKGLDELTGKMVGNIRDETIRKLVQARCTKDVKGKWVVPKDAFKTPLLMASGVPVKKVRVKFPGEESKYKELQPKKFVKTGSNHLVAIYVKPNSKKGVEYLEQVVSLFDAFNRVKQNKPEFEKKHPNEHDAIFLVVLHKNDMLEKVGSDGIKSYWRVQKIAPGNMWIRPHTFAGKPDEDENYIQITPALLPANGYKKVTIDPLGRVLPAMRKVKLLGEEYWVEGEVLKND